MGRIDVPPGPSSGTTGALVVRTSSQSIPNNTMTAISWSTEEYDDDGYWTSGSAARLTVPSGVTAVRLAATVDFAANATSTERLLEVRKNATAFPRPAGLGETRAVSINGSVTTLQVVTARLVVTAGDYFELYARQQSGGALNIANTADSRCWLSIESVR